MNAYTINGTRVSVCGVNLPLLVFLLTLLVYPIGAERFLWFDTVSGAFTDPKHWYGPDGTLNPVVLRNPNPRNLIPGAADEVSFARSGVDDVDRTGAAYEVMVPTATVSLFEAATTPRPGTIQPLTFAVGTLTAERLNLSGKIFVKGGQISGNGANNFLADVTFTGKAAVTLYREACELKDVSNLKNRATWEEDGKRYEGCFGVFFDAAIGFYFDDKQVAVIPVAAFVPVRGM